MMRTPMAQLSRFTSRWLSGSLRRLLLVSTVASGSVFCTLTSSPDVASAAIVERVVAVVGEKAILLSDIKERALPILLRVYATVPEGPQRAAAISQIYSTLLQRMVDEELEELAAKNSGIVISTEEVNEALARVSAQNQLTVNEVLIEAKRSGLSVASYRDELRRQLLQAKMSQLRLRGRIQVTEKDTDAAYKRLATQERMQQVQRTVQLRIPIGKGEAEQAKQRALAESISERARRGEDFQELVEEHATSSGSGLAAPKAPMQEPKPIQRASLALDVGETSLPVKHGGNWVIVQVVERPPSELPPLEDIREEMHQQVYMEKMAEAREHWLKGLRRRTHVEIRL